MKNLLLYLWQLPQNILGLILLILWPAQKSLVYKGVRVNINDKFPSGISLGEYIILKTFPYNAATWMSVKHEWGHTRQSRKWGWLYLIVIGVPSLLCNIWDRVAHKNWDWKKSYDWYYSLPWEKNADKYGEVKR